MKTTAEKIAVMQAFDVGKKIEFCCKGSVGWEDAHAPSWDWLNKNYRVKPEPRTFYVNEYLDGSYGTPHLSADKAAIFLAASGCGGRTIKVVEVLD